MPVAVLQFMLSRTAVRPIGNKSAQKASKKLHTERRETAKGKQKAVPKPRVQVWDCLVVVRKASKIFENTIH